MELLKLLNANEIFWQIVNFLILLFVLKAFAWKKLLKLLDDRRERIASEFKNIEEAKSAIADLKSDYQAKITNIDKEAREKIKEAIQEGKSMAEDIKKEAHQNAQKILETARGDIKYELTQAKEELKEKIINLTIQASEAVIQDKLSEDEDRKIIRNFLDKVETAESTDER